MSDNYFEKGQILFRSAENLRRSSSDLNALMNSIWEMISEKKVDFGNVELAKPQEGISNDGWIYSSSACNFILYENLSATRSPKPGRKPKQKPIGTITILVRLCGIEEDESAELQWPWLNQACLIVGWHKSRQESGEIWAIENFEARSENTIHHCTNGLWVWKEDVDDYAFFFALPIFALRNENDLKNLVLKPLKILFETDDPRSMAATALSNIPALTPGCGFSAE